MSNHPIVLNIGNKRFTDNVSSTCCDHVSDFKHAIKKQFYGYFKSYDACELTIFSPDCVTEIDPATPINEIHRFKKDESKPIIVTVEEEIPRRVCKRMAAQVSCQKYLDSIARILFCDYEFKTAYEYPIFDDLLAAKDGKEGDSWNYRRDSGSQNATIPFPDIFSDQQWGTLKILNDHNSHKLYNGRMYRTGDSKPLIIIPDSDYTKDDMEMLKRIAFQANLVDSEDELIVKSESEISK